MHVADVWTDARLTGRAQDEDHSAELTDILRVSIVDRLDQLSRYADAWNALSYEVPPRLPTASYAWASAFFEHFVTAGKTWCCFFAHKGDHLLGVLPLTVSRGARLRLAWLSTPMSGHMIAVSPLLFPGQESDVLRALLDAAWARYPDAVWIEIRDLPANTPLLEHADEHWHLKISNRSGRYLWVGGDQGQYQSSLSKNFRSNQRKATNKLRKLRGVDVEFVSEPDASNAQLAEFIPVEASGWKGRRGTAIQMSSELIAFYKTLTTRLAKAGWLEWHFLRAEGRVIAANLAVRFNRSIIVWKLGYDEDYRRYSPGGLLFQALLDRAFADPEIDEVNLLTNAPWYDNWEMAERQYHRIRFYRRRRLVSVFLGFVPDGLISVAYRSKTIRAIARAGVRWMRRVVSQS